MPVKTKKSAGSRIKDQGRSLVWSTFTADEKHDLRVAAAHEAKPMSALVHYLTMKGVATILEKMEKNR